MRVLILTKYPTRGPSSRYRFYQYLPELAAAGVRFTVQPFFTDSYLTTLFAGQSANPLYLATRVVARLARCLGGKRYDLAWIEGELTPFLPALWERGLHLLLPQRRVYEFDDAIWLRYENRAWLKDKFRSILRDAAGVVVGNAFLERYVASINPRTRLIPTTVDWRRYETAAPKLDGHTVGWIGSQNTAFYLEGLAPALRRVAERRPLRLKAVGANIEAPGLDVVCEPWSAETEIEALSGFDIGVMPLADDRWSAGKCGLKLVQYQAAGVPAVASPVGVNRTYLAESGGGYAAENEQEWEAALDKLLANRVLRQEMGRRGREWVKERMTLQAQAPRLIEFLHECADEAPVKKR